MNRYALVVNGVVTNVALWDGVTAWSPPGEWANVTDQPLVGPGWTYADGVFAAPIDPV